MLSLLEVEAAAISLIKENYRSVLNIGLITHGDLWERVDMRSAFKSVFLLAEFIRAFYESYEWSVRPFFLFWSLLVCYLVLSGEFK